MWTPPLLCCLLRPLITSWVWSLHACAAPKSTFAVNSLPKASTNGLISHWFFCSWREIYLFILDVELELEEKIYGKKVWFSSLQKNCDSGVRYIDIYLTFILLLLPLFFIVSIGFHHILPLYLWFDMTHVWPPMCNLEVLRCSNSTLLTWRRINQLIKALNHLSHCHRHHLNTKSRRSEQHTLTLYLGLH